jgi:hypothetical protein
VRFGLFVVWASSRNSSLRRWWASPTAALHVRRFYCRRIIPGLIFSWRRSIASPCALSHPRIAGLFSSASLGAADDGTEDAEIEKKQVTSYIQGSVLPYPHPMGGADLTFSQYSTVTLRANLYRRIGKPMGTSATAHTCRHQNGGIMAYCISSVVAVMARLPYPYPEREPVPCA